MLIHKQPFNHVINENADAHPVVQPRK